MLVRLMTIKSAIVQFLLFRIVIYNIKQKPEFFQAFCHHGFTH